MVAFIFQESMWNGRLLKFSIPSTLERAGGPKDFSDPYVFFYFQEDAAWTMGDFTVCRSDIQAAQRIPTLYL